MTNVDTQSRIERAFEQTINRFYDSAALRFALSADFGREHYGSILREIFHQTRENPQIQALTTVHFRGREREAVRLFLKHSLSEFGHDQLALNDRAALGLSNAGLDTETPLPQTSALFAFGFHQAMFVGAAGYLGYLYFLEFMPTQTGERLAQAVGRAGVPREACSFLTDHIAIDVGHNRLMQDYIQIVLTSEDRLAQFLHSMETTAWLYSEMMRAAMAEVERPSLRYKFAFERRD